jgi:hypothetical protein
VNTLNRVLLFLHFLGLALGFSVSFANIVMSSLVARAAPSEKPVLGRFPPMMSRMGTIGLTLLWITGGTLVYTKWGGFASLPWQFDVKLAAVVLLTITTRYIHRIEPLLQTGGPAVMARVQGLGKLATSLALIALLFAVLTFD